MSLRPPVSVDGSSRLIRARIPEQSHAPTADLVQSPAETARRAAALASSVARHAGPVDAVVRLALLAALEECPLEEAVEVVLTATSDDGVLRRARARIGLTQLHRPSVVGHRAEEVLARASETLSSTGPTVPRQAESRDRVAAPPGPRVEEMLVLAGTMDSVARAARFVEENACRSHLPTLTGRAVLLTHELVGQAVRRRRGRPARLTLECDATGLTLAVHVSGIGVGAFGPRGRKRLGVDLIESIADEWGAEPWGKGVRLWARVLPEPSHAATVGVR